MPRVEKTVFVSYRRTDFPWAFAIYSHLTHRGFDVFFDYMGVASGDFESVILENIRARAHFLIVLTPRALDRCIHPEDWLRREIEESIECRRNIVPLLVDGFDFCAPAIAARLTGKLSALKCYNAVGMPAEYFDAALDKLCLKFLNVPLEAVLHPASDLAQEVAKEQRAAVSTDVLTGLISRREFESRIERALSIARAHQSAYAICLLVVDQLRIVKGIGGHRAVDALLSEVGALLKSKMHARDTLARLDNDEFAILFENCSLEEAATAAESLREAIASFKFFWQERPFHLSVSIGVAPISAESEDLASVMFAADGACQAAKEAGRNRVCSVAENDIDLMRRRRDARWAADVNSALADGRFELLCQTILPLNVPETGLRYELLVRMRDSERRMLEHSEFMPAAERHSMGSSIDRWVIKRAFAWLASDGADRADIAMCSINVSGQSVSDEKFLAFVMSQFETSQLNGAKICFEISEAAAIASFHQANQFIRGLQALGCKFALDDFGTGLSSFGHLKHFPVDFLKIDGSFVREILRDPIDREMVRSINEIAHLTGKQTIAVCAESREIIEILRHLGVDYAQGDGVSLPDKIIAE